MHSGWWIQVQLALSHMTDNPERQFRVFYDRHSRYRLNGYLKQCLYLYGFVWPFPLWSPRDVVFALWWCSRWGGSGVARGRSAACSAGSGRPCPVWWVALCLARSAAGSERAARICRWSSRTWGRSFWDCHQTRWSARLIMWRDPSSSSKRRRGYHGRLATQSKSTLSSCNESSLTSITTPVTPEPPCLLRV